MFFPLLPQPSFISAHLDERSNFLGAGGWNELCPLRGKCSRRKSKWNASSVIFYPWASTHLIKILTRRSLTQTGGNSISLMLFAVAFLTCLIFLRPHTLRPPRAWTRCPVPFSLGPFDFYCFYSRFQSWLFVSLLHHLLCADFFFFFFLGAVRRLNNSDSDHVSLASGLQSGGKFREVKMGNFGNIPN